MHIQFAIEIYMKITNCPTIHKSVCPYFGPDPEKKNQNFEIYKNNHFTPQQKFMCQTKMHVQNALEIHMKITYSPTINRYAHIQVVSLKKRKFWNLEK